MPCPTPVNESSPCIAELAKNRKLNALCSTFSLRGQYGNFLNLELFSAIKMLFLMAQGNCEHKYYLVFAIRVLQGTVPPSSTKGLRICSVI